MVEAAGKGFPPDKPSLAIKIGIKAQEYFFPKKGSDGGSIITLEVPVGDFLLVLRAVDATRANSFANRQFPRCMSKDQKLLSNFAAEQQSAFEQLSSVAGEEWVDPDGTKDPKKIKVRPRTARSMVQALAGATAVPYLELLRLNLRDPEDKNIYRDNIATKIHILSIIENLLSQMAEQNLPVAREKLEQLREVLQLNTSLKESI